MEIAFLHGIDYTPPEIPAERKPGYLKFGRLD
jgi:hypothetical protein